jgi:AcrR family transcriptional regulator
VTATDQPRRRGRPASGSREAILEATLEVLRERGIKNLTSREVAARAGVSDASVYYHFGDRAGLLKAVFERAVQPLKSVGTIPPGADCHAVLEMAAKSLEAFFDQLLPVLAAAQADPETKRKLAAYIAEHNLGPHRGVQALGGFLKAEQAAGRVNATVDVEAVALMVIDVALGRATRRQMLEREQLPSRDRMLAVISRLLD